MSRISHELRTPLNAILGFSELLQQEKKIDEEHLELIRLISQSGHILRNLVDEVLDLSKIESGHIDIHYESVNLIDIVLECHSLLTNELQKSSLTLSYDKSTNVSVYADRTRLKEVLLNILSNAIKYNKAEGSISIEVECRDNRALVRVDDTGIGIPAEDLESIFHTFERLEKNNIDTEGNGLGLAITQKLVELMNGSIGVESEEGKGSTFWFSLPTNEQNNNKHNSYDDISQENNDTSVPTSDTANTKLNIIYIEDNLANLRLVEKILQNKTEFVLHSSADPEEGLELIKRVVPDLILVDINLPKMNGYELLKLIKEDSDLQNIQVFAVSAKAMTHDIEKGQDSSFDGYITKPLDITYFVSVLDRCYRDKIIAKAHK